jgi:hypothetical protein
MKILYLNLLLLLAVTCSAQPKTWHAEYDCYLAKNADSLTGTSLKSFISDIARMQVHYDVYANNRFVYTRATVISTSPSQFSFTGNETEEALLDKSTSILYKITEGKAYRVIKDSAVADSARQTDITTQKWLIKRQENISLITSSDLPAEVTPTVYVTGLPEGIKQVTTEDYVFMLDKTMPGTFDFQKTFRAARIKCRLTDKYQSLF